MPCTPQAQKSMDRSTADEYMPASQLLKFPREIRDLIWEHAIVRNTIPIDCAVVEGPGYRRHTGFPCPLSPQLHKAYPLNHGVTWRRTWSLPIYDLKVDIGGGTWMEPKRARMTYQIAPPCTKPKHAGSADRIQLQLLQVCRAIHNEARVLFYKKNVFSFMGHFPVSTALAFLQDRPASALSQLSSLEIMLTEDNNIRGTTDAHFPQIIRSSGCLVLQYAFDYYTDLCTLLSSPAIHLRTLRLTIESLSSSGDVQPESLSECLAWELGKSSSERPWIVSWIQPLLEIKSLETIQVYWVSDRPQIRRMSDTLSLMQRLMLDGAGVSQNDKTHPLKGHEIEFGILGSHYDHVVTTIIFEPNAEHFEWGDCSCDDRAAGLELSAEETFERAFYKCGAATWKEHQRAFTGFKSAYTAYCELKSTRSPRSARGRSSACAIHLDR